ncbi:penicillin-binding protein activator [Sphingobium sp. B11D3A]|uniref:penicillin-binding protein activator n=1 Tax=Sphingobium sp. B11D3A TaxID=2940574 RepID=UPI0039B42B31|nr:ABC-type branched-subunit amino acid transport system substrate-binding protein [Sphingobium sp. B11D3A]
MAERSLAGQVRFDIAAGGTPTPRRILQGIVLIGAMLLAACTRVVPPAQQPAPPPKTQQPDVTQGLPTDTERHRIALLVPMSGTNAGVGRSLANATTMALLDTKTERLRVTTYDTGRNPAEAARKAVAEGNKLILGPLTADEVRAVAPIARAANIPVLSYSNDESVAGNGVYLLGYSPEQSVSRVVRFARARGLSDFAALVPRGVYGERAGKAFLSEVKAAGGTVVAMETFDRSANSVQSAVQRLSASSSYDALLIADVGRIALQAAPLVRTAGARDARILGTELWATEAGLSASTALRGAWYAGVSDGLYRTLATKYRSTYGAAPYRLASLGYDSVLLTVRIAQDWKPGSAFPAARLRDAEGFAGIDGAFRFGRDGIAERALEVQQVGASGSTVVDTAPKGFGR